MLIYRNCGSCPLMSSDWRRSAGASGSVLIMTIITTEDNSSLYFKIQLDSCCHTSAPCLIDYLKLA